MDQVLMNKVKYT